MNQDFSWKIRVYYEDTDAGGVVFYANYLKFFERARTEWLRAMGVGQHALAAQQRIMFIVKSTAVDYLAPARLDDTLRMTVKVARLGRASVSFTQEAWRVDAEGNDQMLLARGAIDVVCVKASGAADTAGAVAAEVAASIPDVSNATATADNFRPTAIPQSILNSIRSTGVQAAARSSESSI